MSQNEKDRLALRVEPELRKEIERHVAAGDGRSINQFLNDALRHYLDYLDLQRAGPLLPREIMVAIDGRLGQFEDRFARLAYKTAVELDMQNGLLADAFNVPEDDMRRRRAESVKNVKHTNGRISLEQRMRDSDVELTSEDADEWPG